MKCPSRNRSVRDGSKFCTRCGEKLPGAGCRTHDPKASFVAYSSINEKGKSNAFKSRKLKLLSVGILLSFAVAVGVGVVSLSMRNDDESIAHKEDDALALSSSANEDSLNSGSIFTMSTNTSKTSSDDVFSELRMIMRPSNFDKLANMNFPFQVLLPTKIPTRAKYAKVSISSPADGYGSSQLGYSLEMSYKTAEQIGGYAVPEPSIAGVDMLLSISGYKIDSNHRCDQKLDSQEELNIGSIKAFYSRDVTGTWSLQWCRDGARYSIQSKNFEEAKEMLSLLAVFEIQ